MKISNSVIVLHTFISICHSIPTDDSDDDAVDGKFGLFCSDGTFVQRPWPPEKQCVELALCENVNLPDPSKRFKPLTKSVFKMGEFIHYECQEDSAILDDNSGRNYFSLLCDGENTLGIYEAAYNLTQESTENETASVNVTEVFQATFTPINSSFEFPKCRPICINFYVGRVDFKAVNESIVVRAGEVAEFSCKPGYFIDGSDHFNRSIISMCQEDGTFTPTTAKCTPIPCTAEDITDITPLNGIFYTESEDEVAFGESITFECTDEDKVPNQIGVPEIEVRCLLGGTFQVPEWPGNHNTLFEIFIFCPKIQL